MTCFDIVCISAGTIAEMQTKTEKTLISVRKHAPIMCHFVRKTMPDFLRVNVFHSIPLHYPVYYNR